MSENSSIINSVVGAATYIIDGMAGILSMIHGILAELGVDQTIFFQFAIVLTLYVLAKKILFNPLQSVIEIRKDKTERAEGQAKDYIEKYEELKRDYTDKINGAHKEAQVLKTQGKSEVEKKTHKEFKEKESILNKEFEDRKAQEVSIIMQKKKEIMSSSDELAELLVSKVMQ